MSLLVLALLASVSFAGPGALGGPGRSRDVVTTEDTEEETCEPPVAEEELPVEEEEPPVAEEEPPVEEEECVADDDDGFDEEGATDDGSEPAETETDAERGAACMQAAGIEPSEEETGGGDEPVKAYGLDNAIEHVLANCVKNPQAPGLLNALERLSANRERHEAHEEWKTERKAERDAAKAERKAEKADGTHGSGKEHGSGGKHGNPHDGGSNGGGNGQGGSHGNGH